MSEVYCRPFWPVVRHAQSFQRPQVKIYTVLISTGVHALGNHLSVKHKQITRHTTTVNRVMERIAGYHFVFESFWRVRMIS
jgi:hypothetical protein